MNLKFFYTFIILLFSPFSLLVAGEKHSVSQIMQLALKNTLIAEGNEAVLAEKKGQLRQARAIQNPQLSVGGGLYQSGVAPGSYFQLSLSQPVYFPGRQKSLVSLYESRANAAAVELELARQQLLREIWLLSYDYQLLLLKSHHFEERLRRFRLMEGFMESRPFVSPQKRIEKDIVKSKLQMLEMHLLKVNAEKDMAWARLNYFLRLPGQIEVDLNWLENIPAIDWEKARAESVAKNPYWQKEQLLLQEKTAELRVAEKSAIPDITVSGYFSREQNSFYNDTYIGGGLSAALPVFEQGQHQVASARAALDAENIRSGRLRIELEQKWNELLVAYRASRENLQRTKGDIIVRNESEMNFADEQFQKGLIDLISYLEVETQFHDLHETIYDSKIEFVRIYSEMLVFLGTDLLSAEPLGLLKGEH